MEASLASAGTSGVGDAGVPAHDHGRLPLLVGALGFQAHSGTRVLVHGVAGCFFFGALTSKVLIVRSRRMPGWELPLAGEAVFAALTVIWVSSSLWFFTNIEFPGL